MKKTILVESYLKEDDAVFDLEEPVEFPNSLSSPESASKILASEIDRGDITDKTSQFKAGLKAVEDTIHQYKYDIRGMDVSEFENQFIENVLGFKVYGPEMHHNLTDFGVELDLKAIDNTSGVIPVIADPALPLLSHRLEKAKAKHIIHKTMDPVIILGWSKGYIRKIPEFIVEQLLLDGVLAETISNATNHLGLFEHLSEVDDWSKEIRKAYFDIKYAIGHKDMPTVRQIQDQLKSMLEDVEGELIGQHEGDSQKLILRGTGLVQSLIDILVEKDIVINQFKVIGGDF